MYLLIKATGFIHTDAPSGQVKCIFIGSDFIQFFCFIVVVGQNSLVMIPELQRRIDKAMFTPGRSVTT